MSRALLDKQRPMPYNLEKTLLCEEAINLLKLVIRIEREHDISSSVEIMAHILLSEALMDIINLNSLNWTDFDIKCFLDADENFKLAYMKLDKYEKIFMIFKMN